MTATQKMQMITPKKVPQLNPPPSSVATAPLLVGEGVAVTGEGVGAGAGVGAGVAHCGAGVGTAAVHCRRRASGTMPLAQVEHVPPVPAELSAQG